MQIKDLTDYLETIAPLAFQEGYDNAGLIVGNKNMPITGALLCLDSTEIVVDEAIELGFNLIIAHHPIVFEGLKKFNGNTYVERVVMKAIQHNIAIYAIHTNLDNILSGVNAKIAEKLGLSNTRILQPKDGLLKKLVTYCPITHAQSIRAALFYAGAGTIGNYDECSFNSDGLGTFKGNNQTNPYIGTKEVQHQEAETRIETIFPIHLESKIIQALLQAHPYEEVAYDLFTITNKWNTIGAGLIGTLPTPQPIMDFLQLVKEQLHTGCIKYTQPIQDTIQKIAVCGGSGSFLLKDAIKQGADMFITSDYKYHQFFDADKHLVIADVGHYESEQFTSELLHDFLTKKFPTFAVRFSKLNTNPVKYL